MHAALEKWVGTGAVCGCGHARRGRAPRLVPPGRWLRAGLVLVGLWVSTVGPALAVDRTEGEGGAAPVPITVTPVVTSAGLDAVTPLPGGSIPWAAVAVPPVLEGAGGGTLVQGGGAPQLRYYALDALGSVRVVFDAAGQVVGRADYEPFGAAVPASTTGTLPRQQYTGHERDGEVGVDYFGARMYAPTLGRMPSVDPLYVGAIEDPQRWNRYAYARSNPVSMSESRRPTGGGVLLVELMGVRRWLALRRLQARYVRISPAYRARRHRQSRTRGRRERVRPDACRACRAYA